MNQTSKIMDNKLTFKKAVFIFLIVFVIILIFTFIDYLVHLLSEEYAVSSYYYRNKIIFGTGIGFVVYLFVGKKKLFVKSLIFSAVISILLQTRYFLEGYSLEFVFEFLLFHFLMLVPVSLLFFWLFRNKI